MKPEQVSALGWGAFGIGMVFLLAPVEAYAWPIILSLSLGDPFLGEMRRRGIETRNVILSSVAFLFLVWVACWHFFSYTIMAGLFVCTFVCSC